MVSKEPHDESPSERPRGILTPSDREFLSGQTELSDSARRNARQRIRERVQASMADFELLWQCLSDRDLELIFHPDEDEEQERMRSRAQDAVSFIRLGMWINQDPHPKRLGDSIEQAAFAAGYASSASVSLNLERLPDGSLLLAKLKQKIQTVDTLRERLENDELGEKSESDVIEELEQEKSYLYYYFEKSLYDPKIDPESLLKLGLFEEEQLEPEDIERERRGLEESPIERRKMPVVLNVSPRFREGATSVEGDAQE